MRRADDERTIILGISAYYHDSAAALLVDGHIVAAAHEERFTRKKHDDSFPEHAMRYVLSEYGLSVSDLDAIVFYDKPLLKFERLLETYHGFAPRGFSSFATAMPSWLQTKVFLRSVLWKEIEKANGGTIAKKPKLLFSEHHLSHAASAFYPSPFERAAILTVDGVGEWATTTISIGEKNKITMLREMNFPHSLGLLYSAFTYWCGFKVNSGEYKLMGLAPYGRAGSPEVAAYKKKIYGHLIDAKEDGSLFLNMEYFDFATGLRMCRDEKWGALFGIPKRNAESEITQEYMDLALAIQEVTDEVMLRLAKTAKELTGADSLVMAGGVALNCVSNAKIVRSGLFRGVWIQPAAGDAGGALGAAYVGHHIYFGKQRDDPKNEDAMEGSYLGPEFSNEDVLRVIRTYGATGDLIPSCDTLAEKVAPLLAEGSVVGWFQGRMEWGPRALGNRSILGDPRNPGMQKTLNLKIKYREGFRPFAPAVLEEDAQEYFEGIRVSPYMLLVAPVKEERRRPIGKDGASMLERLYEPRSDVPAITHLDYSARLQTVSKKTNPRFAGLIEAFRKKTGCGVLVNTSFNVRGEPIVCTPEDAYRCFMNTEMDYLVVGNFLFSKKDQPAWEKIDIAKTYGLD